MWAIGNFAGDGAETRDELYKTAIMDFIDVLLSGKSLPLSFVQLICWTLSGLSRGKPNPPFEKVGVLE